MSCLRALAHPDASVTSQESHVRGWVRTETDQDRMVDGQSARSVRGRCILSGCSTLRLGTGVLSISKNRRRRGPARVNRTSGRCAAAQRRNRHQHVHTRPVPRKRRPHPTHGKHYCAAPRGSTRRESLAPRNRYPSSKIGPSRDIALPTGGEFRQSFYPAHPGARVRGHHERRDRQRSRSSDRLRSARSSFTRIG